MPTHARPRSRPRLASDRRALATYRYWLLEPGGVQRRIVLGPVKGGGRFTKVERKNGKAASEAWHVLDNQAEG